MVGLFGLGSVGILIGLSTFSINGSWAAGIGESETKGVDTNFGFNTRFGWTTAIGSMAGKISQISFEDMGGRFGSEKWKKHPPWTSTTEENRMGEISMSRPFFGRCVVVRVVVHPVADCSSPC